MFGTKCFLSKVQSLIFLKSTKNFLSRFYFSLWELIFNAQLEKRRCSFIIVWQKSAIKKTSSTFSETAYNILYIHYCLHDYYHIHWIKFTLNYKVSNHLYRATRLLYWYTSKRLQCSRFLHFYGFCLKNKQFQQLLYLFHLTILPKLESSWAVNKTCFSRSLSKSTNYKVINLIWKIASENWLHCN